MKLNRFTSSHIHVRAGHARLVDTFRGLGQGFLRLVRIVYRMKILGSGLIAYSDCIGFRLGYLSIMLFMGIGVEYGKRRLYCLGLSGILQKSMS